MLSTIKLKLILELYILINLNSSILHSNQVYIVVCFITQEHCFLFTVSNSLLSV